VQLDRGEEHQPGSADGATATRLLERLNGEGFTGGYTIVPGEMRRALDETLAEPAKDDSRLAWLWRLVEPQVRRRVESRAERRTREARLPSPPRSAAAVGAQLYRPGPGPA
jgi:hypothetical protein